MKKYFSILAVLLLALACKDYSYDRYEPDTELRTSGEVSLLVSFENLSTKVYMDDTGHGFFEKGDALAVALSDGNFVEFHLDGTGDTRRAIFTGTIPEGKQIGKAVIYPASAVVAVDGDNLTLSLPAEQTLSSSYPGILVGRIGTDWAVELRQILSFMNLTLSNFPVEAVDMLITDELKPLNGIFSVTLDALLDRGLKASDVDVPLGGGSVFRVTKSSKTVYALVPMPADEFSHLGIAFRDKNGKELVSQSISEYAVRLDRGVLSRLALVCGEVPAPPCRINVGGDRTQMEETSEGVFEGSFDVPAVTSFTIELFGVPYGFATRSGAGGLGTISSVNSALPAARIKNAGKSKKTYYVKRSIGTMALTELADNPFTIDLESPGRIHVSVDTRTAEAPKYRIQLEETPDPDVLFHEDFDLCVFGGDYLAPTDGYGSTIADYDGYLPGTKSPTQNQPGFNFDYPEKNRNNLPREGYLEAYGLDGWRFDNAGERPSGMQICTGAVAGSMTTPAFTAIQGNVDAVLTLDMARFSATSTSPIYVNIIGDGTFDSASVRRDAYHSARTGESFEQAAYDYTTFAGDGKQLVLEDDTYFPHSIDNADIDKPVSHYSCVLKGISASTKIQIDAPKGPSSAPRMFLFDIKLTRK